MPRVVLDDAIGVEQSEIEIETKSGLKYTIVVPKESLDAVIEAGMLEEVEKELADIWSRTDPNLRD